MRAWAALNCSTTARKCTASVSSSVGSACCTSTPSTRYPATEVPDQANSIERTWPASLASQHVIQT
eukprot:2677087-Rhodomonas_salina.1